MPAMFHDGPRVHDLCDHPRQTTLSLLRVLDFTQIFRVLYLLVVPKHTMDPRPPYLYLCCSCAHAGWCTHRHSHSVPFGVGDHEEKILLQLRGLHEQLGS